jgi:hypothetical protein
MRITLKEKVTDPDHPIMHGDGAIAKEFNRRQAILWKDGKFQKFDFEQVSTILLEIMADDYDKRHGPRKKKIVK